MNSSIVVFLALFGVALSQFAPLPYTHHSQEPAPIHEDMHEAPLAHPAVVANSLREQQYPDEYRNNQYKNPAIAQALAKESWFTDKEMPVYERKADSIPREQVFKIFKNAGFIRRR